jgi:hypothetical protein
MIVCSAPGLYMKIFSETVAHNPYQASSYKPGIRFARFFRQRSDHIICLKTRHFQERGPVSFYDLLIQGGLSADLQASLPG